MENNKIDYLTPALVCGGAAGVVSALPFLNLVNCLCCLWIVGASAAAVYLVSRRTPTGLKAGDGALTGVLTGVIAAVAETVVGLPLKGFNLAISKRFLEKMSEFAPEMPAGWDEWLSRTSGGFSPAFFLLGLFVTAAVFAVFGALGGVIGVSLFGRPKTPVQPIRPPAQGPGDAA
jgi:hypothetical protein